MDELLDAIRQAADQVSEHDFLELLRWHRVIAQQEVHRARAQPHEAGEAAAEHREREQAAIHEAQQDAAVARAEAATLREALAAVRPTTYPTQEKS